MAWQHILGHDEMIDRFRVAMRRGRLASSFLFTGPSGIGKTSVRAESCPGIAV